MQLFFLFVSRILCYCSCGHLHCWCMFFSFLFIIRLPCAVRVLHMHNNNFGDIYSRVYELCNMNHLVIFNDYWPSSLSSLIFLLFFFVLLFSLSLSLHLLCLDPGTVELIGYQSANLLSWFGCSLSSLCSFLSFRLFIGRTVRRHWSSLSAPQRIFYDIKHKFSFGILLRIYSYQFFSFIIFSLDFLCVRVMLLLLDLFFAGICWCFFGGDVIFNEWKKIQKIYCVADKSFREKI